MVYYLKTITKYSKLTKLGLGNVKGGIEEKWIDTPPLLMVDAIYDVECSGEWKGTPKVSKIEAYTENDETTALLKKIWGPKRVPTIREIATLASEYVSKTPDQSNKYYPRVLTVDMVMEALKFYLSDEYEGEHRAAKFVKCPASLRSHDTQDGGLLRHTAKLLEAASKIAAEGQFNEYKVNPLILVTGILLHDEGKVDQYIQNEQGFWEQNPHAAMIGNHIGYGFRRWCQKGHTVCEILGDTSMFDEVLNMIASHHGPVSNGFGSFVDPAGPNAWTLHSLDLFESRQDETYKPIIDEES